VTESEPIFVSCSEKTFSQIYNYRKFGFNWTEDSDPSIGCEATHGASIVA
jgi:hypothetical protein